MTREAALDSIRPSSAVVPSGSRRSAFLLLLATFGFVLIPFLFWKSVWFGRVLDDQELTEYLQDEGHPRRMQHALAQLVDRIERGEAGVERFYGSVSHLADHPLPEVRTTAAWAMAHAPRSTLFHETLRRLLHDPEPVVRRNAALSLVRFGDRRGLAEIRAMIQPHPVLAPVGGVISRHLVEPGEDVQRGTGIVRLRTGAGELDVPSGVPGRVQELPARGTRVEAGETLLLLWPDPTTAWESLRALYLVGEADELALIGKLLDEPGYDEAIRAQAQLTHEAIRRKTLAQE